MYIKVLLIVALLPVYLLLYFVNKMDKIKEPSNLLSKLFFGGAVLSVILTLTITAIFEFLFSDLNASLSTVHNGPKVFIYYFFFVALIEEFSKFIVIMIFGYNDRSFDEEYDGIVYSIYASLGFAALENILYVFTGGVGTGLVRAVLSIPGHASFGFVMGLFITKAKILSVNNQKNKSYLYLALALIAPAILHCIFDSCLSINELRAMAFYYIFVVIVNIVAVITCIKISRSSKLFVKEEKKFIGLVQLCPCCKAPVLNNRYCIRCGSKVKEDTITN